MSELVPPSAPGDAFRSASRLRLALYLLLAVSSLLWTGWRILHVQNAAGTTPFLSANDRSRWATVRALVDEHTFALDRVILTDLETWEGDPDWNTIDKVYHLGPDGREHFYSSKPPLLSVLLAGEYWCVSRLTGWKFAEHPLAIGRTMLLVTNGLLMLLLFYFLACLFDRYAPSDWTRITLFAAACWGTFLSTFAVTLNNHLPAAVAVAAAVFFSAPIWCDQKRESWRFVLAGLAAGFAFACELPALLLVVVLGGGLLLKSPRRTLLAYAPAVALLVAALLATNYWAHGTIRLAYDSRQDGPPLAEINSAPRADLESGWMTTELSRLLAESEPHITTQRGDEIWEIIEHRLWSVLDTKTHQRYLLERIDQSARSGESLADSAPSQLALRIRLRGNWYIFPGSYWLDGNRSPIDQGEPSIPRYAFHTLLGHHGLFSLTPFWLLAVLGLVWSLRGGGGIGRVPAAAVALIVLVCFAFYLTRPEIDRNYGGQTSGLRWTFWLIPLFLLSAIPAVEAFGRCWKGKTICLVLLALSIASAAYSWQNPWVHPWLYAWLNPAP